MSGPAPRPGDVDAAEPPCPHAADCGGCAHQDLSLDGLAAWKRRRVVAALARRGLDAEVAPPLAAPERSRRRARFAAVRGKKSIRIGFYRARSHEVVDLATCLLVRPALMAARPHLEALARLAAPRSRPIGLFLTETETGLDVAVEDAKPLDLALREQAAAWAVAADAARLSWNGEPVAERRPPVVRFGAAAVTPPPGAFLQPTAEGEAMIAEIVEDATRGARRIADLFCGCGAFALRLAARSEIIAVEGAAPMIAALEKAWRRTDGLKRVDAETRDLFRRPMRAEELKDVDAVIFDPPRQGAEAQARALAEHRGAAIVGVSCDPETFARDAALLAGGGWRLRRVQPIDQFLWSAHTELVGVFERDR